MASDQVSEAVWDADDTLPEGGYWVSEGVVAEIGFVALSGKKKAQQVLCRLVVRGARWLQPDGSDGTMQGELFAAHRDHAIIEQVIAELKDGSLAHPRPAVAGRRRPGWRLR